MNDIFNWLYVAGAVVLLFGAAVFVHEFGHYWMALRRKMKVEAFAIGFGPKIFGWKKNGIDYSWRWIPAGGFVRIPQMVTSEALEGKDKEVEEEPIPPADPWSKILVAFAGPFMNIVFAFAIATLLYFTGLPVLVNPSFVGYVDPESPEGKMGIREGDRIVQVDSRPTKSWHDVMMATILARTNVVPVVIEREGERLTYHLETELEESGIGGKHLRLYSQDLPVIQGVQEGAAQEAGLKAGDQVMKFGGVTVAGVQQLIDLVEERGGQPTPIEIKRGDEIMMFTVTPKGDPGKIGVALGSSSVNVYELQKPGPTPWAAISEVVVKTYETLGAIMRPKETGVGPSDLAGPIGIFAMLGSQVNADWRLALNFLILLNVNLAILNLLPLPVLDGGHIVMSLIEMVRKRPLSPKIQEYATTVFALLLISFMLYVSFHDVKRFKLFKLLFEQETQIEETQPAQPESPVLKPAPSE